MYEMENKIAMFQSAPTRNWYPLVAHPQQPWDPRRPIKCGWCVPVMLASLWGARANLRQIDSVPFKTDNNNINIYTHYYVVWSTYLSIDPSINRIHYYQHQSPGNHTPKHRSSRPAKARWAGAPGSSSPGRPKGLGRIYRCRSVS